MIGKTGIVSLFSGSSPVFSGSSPVVGSRTGNYPSPSLPLYFVYACIPLFPCDLYLPVNLQILWIVNLAYS